MGKIDESYGFQMNYTVRNMRRYSTEVFKKEGLDITIDQWGVLQILDENGGNLNHTQLSNLMLKDKPTLTRIVDLLCKKGLTERIPSEDDRRVLNIHLTKPGKKKSNSSLSYHGKGA